MYGEVCMVELCGWWGEVYNGGVWGGRQGVHSGCVGGGEGVMEWRYTWWGGGGGW